MRLPSLLLDLQPKSNWRDIRVHKLHINTFYCTYHSSNITTYTINNYHDTGNQ